MSVVPSYLVKIIPETILDKINDVAQSTNFIPIAEAFQTNVAVLKPAKG